MPFCSLRSTARLSGATSSVMTDPAPTTAPSPMLTGRDQGGVGADEGARPDHRLIFAEPVVIAGDGPGADVGPGPDLGIADVGQMVDLGALADRGFLELDEIADLGALAEPRAGADSRERADARLGADDRALDVAEGVDARAVGDVDAGAEHDMRLDRHVAAELGIVGEPHAFGIDQGRAFVERLLAPAALPFELEVGELGAAVDARRFVGIADDHDRLAAFARRRC